MAPVNSQTFEINDSVEESDRNLDLDLKQTQKYGDVNKNVDLKLIAH